MTRAPRVVVVGDLAVDVVVAPAGPLRPDGDGPAKITTSGGGAGANTATWLAAAGVDVTLAARVGDDPAGRAAVEALTAAGVRAAVAVDPAAPTATVVVLLEPVGPADPPRGGAGHGAGGGGDRRTMLSDRGAAALLEPADLPPLRGVDHVHVSGYVLRDAGSRAAGHAALRAARAAGATTSVDPQATGALDRALLEQVGPVDLLLPATAELAALTGSADPRSAEALLDLAGAVAVTRGAAGATWVGRDGTWSSASPPVAVVDATGAGDAFDAGLLAAWLRGAAPAEALAAGCAAGAAAVSRRGARPGARA